MNMHEPSQRRVEQREATPEETPNWVCLAPSPFNLKTHAVLEKTFEVTSGSNLGLSHAH
jgi:hypothetical protein